MADSKQVGVNKGLKLKRVSSVGLPMVDLFRDNETVMKPKAHECGFALGYPDYAVHYCLHIAVIASSHLSLCNPLEARNSGFQSLDTCRCPESHSSVTIV